MIKRISVFALLVVFSFKLQAQTQVSFSFQAHGDDWQLFMSNKVVADLSSNGKVVFVTLTAGDAGNGIGSYGAVPFYTARENSSVYSAKFAADFTGITAPLDVPALTTVSVNGHNITKAVYKNTVNYYLRLPDGNGNGNGFPITGSKSLRKLKLGTIPTLSAIDGTATYTSWADLTTTIKRIITLERGADNQVWIYSANTNTTINSGDHSDHIYSAIAAQDAVADSLWVGIVEFVDYASASYPANLNNDEQENAAAIFAITSAALSESNYATVFDEGHKSWLPMDIFSVKRSPIGTASFSFANNNASNGLGNIKEDRTALTSIPMVLTITTPAFINRDVNMIISPYEAGQLVTSVYDSEGKIVYEQSTIIENKSPVQVSLLNLFKVKGTYTIINKLNNKYTESKKIVVE